ncbi:MAG: fluoride efflux transporter CrcB [Bacillota bacterium]|nr:fluoride efflux transporter CrcB [Bacillota bacterium]
MKKYFYISIGGALGAICRFLLEGVHIYSYTGNIPLNTLIINVSGSFILALILTLALEIWNFDANIRLGISTGFLGAYTTFSTLCKETVKLLSNGDDFSAVSYITISAVLGLAAAYLGVVLSREVLSKLFHEQKEKDSEVD